jgi:hypothetical protein
LWLCSTTVFTAGGWPGFSVTSILTEFHFEGSWWPILFTFFAKGGRFEIRN